MLTNKALVPANHVPKAYDRVYATSFANQTSELLRRALVSAHSLSLVPPLYSDSAGGQVSYGRRPLIRRARNFRGVLMGLVIGTMFFDLDDSQAGAR